MLSRRIVPCLDVRDGRVVKGVRFQMLRDAGDPAELSARYEAEGADELVFLDITASHEERDIMLDVVRRTAEQVFMPLTVGGGIRTLEDIRELLLAGSDKVSINSAAPRNPQFVADAARRAQKNQRRRNFFRQDHGVVSCAADHPMRFAARVPNCVFGLPRQHWVHRYRGLIQKHAVAHRKTALRRDILRRLNQCICGVGTNRIRAVAHV